MIFSNENRYTFWQTNDGQKYFEIFLFVLSDTDSRIFLIKSRFKYMKF